MKILKQFSCITLAVAIFFATATGVFASNLGRAETREYKVENLNLSLLSDGSNLTISNINLPFEAGSVKVKYSSATSGGTVTMKSGSKTATATFSGSSGEVEFNFIDEIGIEPGSSNLYLSSSDVAATINALTFYKENSPGEDYYQVDVGSGISVPQGLESSAVSVETYFPFDVRSFDISYTNSATSAKKLYYKINSRSASTVSIPAGTGTKRIYLSSSIAPTNAVLKFYSIGTSTITITGITLYKENKVWPDTIDADIEYSEYEDALQTASVFKLGSNIFKNKNAIRYMSYDNTDSATFDNGGVMYAPVDALALAFSLYKEDQGTSYLLRSADDATEYSLNKTSCVSNAAGDDCYSIKSLAETFGYTALASGNYLIVDKYKVRANDIIGNSTILNNLITEFGSYEAQEVSGRTWYVSANASAGGDGSVGSPFKTIQEAANRATAGDRVVIKGGTYRETVIPANSGTAKNPIIFEAASGEQVIVSALDEISGFKLYYDGIYVAKLPVKLDFGSDFVMYNGGVLVEGRQPNSNTSGRIYPSVVTSPLWHTKGNITTPSINIKLESPDGLSNGRDSALRNATYVAFKGLAWGNSFGKVVSSGRTSAAVSDVHNMVYFNKSGELDWGYLTNSKMTLDMPGEWYAKNGVLYIIPPSGVSPNNLKVEAKQRYTTFDLTGKSCIQLKNINTIGGSILMGEGSELNVVNGGTHKFTSHFTYPLDENGVIYSSIASGAPMSKGKSGNYVGGKNNAIVNTRIDTGAGSGIILGGKYGYVAGNTILDVCYSGISDFSGIMFASSLGNETVYTGGHNVHFNTVSKTGRAALGTRPKYINNNAANEKVPFIGSEVSYNDFSYANLLARDSGIIYIHGSSMGNDLVRSEFHHNVLSNSSFNGVWDSLSLVGAYADNYTGNGIYYRNIAYYEDDYVYDEKTYDQSQLKGDELYLHSSYHVQNDYARWGKTYSVFKAHDNMGVFKCPSGFDNTSASNFPSGKIFKYGA